MIDWDFIEAREGFRTIGYVPDAAGSKSGVTIASGFDLGQTDRAELIAMGLPQNLVTLFTPYCGLTGSEAVEILAGGTLTINEDDGRLINRLVRRRAIKALERAWINGAGEPWSFLTTEQRTVLCSVAFQYGDLPRKCPRFWGFAAAGDWDAVIDELRDFGDRYPSRRNLEADLLEV